MFESTAELGAFVLGQSWQFFNIQVPGFNFTFAQMAFGIAICTISLLVLRVMFGIGGRGLAYRVGNSRRHKVSDERKGDEY